jgi:hypothetical protein
MNAREGRSRSRGRRAGVLVAVLRFHHPQALLATVPASADVGVNLSIHFIHSSVSAR